LRPGAIGPIRHSRAGPAESVSACFLRSPRTHVSAHFPATDRTGAPPGRRREPAATPSPCRRAHPSR